MLVLLSLNNSNEWEITHISQLKTDHTCREVNLGGMSLFATGLPPHCQAFLTPPPRCSVWDLKPILNQQQLEKWMSDPTFVVGHIKWFQLKKKEKKEWRLYSRPSHAESVCVRVCVCDSWLTLTAIWFHYGGRRSGAFYGRSRYIPQVWAGREREETKDRRSKVSTVKTSHPRK